MFCGSLGFAYSILKDDIWEASKPIILRQEVNASENSFGRFTSSTDLQAAQELISDMARNREVVGRALRQLGSDSFFAGSDWPTNEVVDAIARNWVTVRAPSSSEFGKTEVIYLATKAETPERAEEFCDLLFQQLSDHLREVRRLRADSIIDELRHATKVAKDSLAEASEQLTKLESSVGIDLGELRGLSESLSGDGGTGVIRSDLEKDIRAAELELKNIEALRELLLRSKNDTNLLLVSDTDLLNTQPTLQRLKSGLIDAQLEASKLSGRVTKTHPRMLAALRSQDTIRSEMRMEIDNVIRTMEPTIELASRKLQTLQKKQDEISRKLQSLASIRTEYSGLVSEVRNRTEILNQAQVDLTEAEALRSAAMNTDLLASLGPPQAGENPVGLGTVKLTVGAMAAGLMMGLGGVFLVAPNPQGERFGRRKSDASGGRRAADQVGHSPDSANRFAIPSADRRSGSRISDNENHSSQALKHVDRVSDNSEDNPPSSVSEKLNEAKYVRLAKPKRKADDGNPEKQSESESPTHGHEAESVRESSGNELSQSSTNDVSSESVPRPKIEVVTPKSKHPQTISEDGTIFWSESPNHSSADLRSSEPGQADNPATDEDAGTCLLDDELIQDLKQAASKNPRRS